MSHFGGPRPISPTDDTASFSSGNADLDRWLNSRALRSETAWTARTYVISDDQTGSVVAFYCISSHSVSRDHVAGAWLGRNAPDPVPVILIGRLAVDGRYRRLGLGRALLKDALRRAITAAEFVGARALLVHAVDDDAANFYRRFDFTPLPSNPRHLYLRLDRLTG